MGIPIATTSITVLRRSTSPTVDSYDAAAATRTVIVTGVRAHFSVPAGTEQSDGGQEESITWRLDCDPCDLTHYDIVRDAADGKEYEVLWAQNRSGFGIGHIEANVRIVEGEL